MAETTKKFLDFTGLQKYNELLKKKVAADIKVVQDDLNTRKVKDIANSDTITWSKAENDTYIGSVTGVVLDNADYTDVKMKAENSAAAWTKFLTGSSVVYPNGITPVLKDLATKKDTSDALASAKSYAEEKATAAETAAKSYADGLAGNYDSKGSAAHALADAKSYADGLNTAMSSRVDALEAIDHNAYKAADEATLASAKSYADGLAKNYDAAGAAAQALADAKAYADTNFDPKGSAEAAKIAAISAANSHTNTEIGKVNDKIEAINTSIAGGVHFRGVVDALPGTPFTCYVNGDIVIVGNKEYILNKPENSEGAWVELGDTTSESQRISALEDDVEILRGTDTVEGSVAKALKDAKTFTTNEINTLVTTGKVKENADAIATLNADAQTSGSVDYKIAQAVANIEASIDTITVPEIEGLFK